MKIPFDIKYRPEIESGKYNEKKIPISDMIKVDVSDNEVKFIFCGDTYISHDDNIIKLFKECKTEREKSRLAINLSVDSSFEVIPKEKSRERKITTLELLEGCAHSVRKLSSYDFDELDDLLGPDPYTPLY